jgi:hypothetical protein
MVTVMSDLPATYPPIVVTFNVAFAVVDENVNEIATRFDLPYKELMLHVVPLPPTPASVLTFA